MNKKNAISLIENQKKEFIEKSFDNIAAWKQKTASMIEDFLGHDSGEFYSFTKFVIGVWALNTESTNKNSLSYHDHMAMIGLLSNCQDKIKRNGLYKKPNQNILSNYDNWKLITIAVIIFLAGLSAGIWLKENTSFVIFTSVNDSSDNHPNNESPINETK